MRHKVVDRHAALAALAIRHQAAGQHLALLVAVAPQPPLEPAVARARLRVQHVLQALEVASVGRGRHFIDDGADAAGDARPKGALVDAHVVADAERRFGGAAKDQVADADVGEAVEGVLRCGAVGKVHAHHVARPVRPQQAGLGAHASRELADRGLQHAYLR